MQNQPLVSIITPGYNCGAVVHRLLDSILAQTWQNIEFIFVNDGSTDNTAEVLESYRDRFDARGISMTVIYQENQGQAVALGNGLLHFNGEFLCWCDSDDYLESDALESRANIMIQNPGCTVVAGQTNVVDCETLTTQRVIAPSQTASHPNVLFMSILQDTNHAYYCCGAYMLRSEAFLNANPERYIYPSRAGQNIQMLLPILYLSSVYVLDKPVYNYVVLPNSHSHTDRTQKQQMERFRDLHTIRVETLKRMRIPVDLQEEYSRASETAMYKVQYSLALQYQNKDLAKAIKRILKSRHVYSLRDAINYWASVNPVFRFVAKKFRNFCKSLQN